MLVIFGRFLETEMMFSKLFTDTLLTYNLLKLFIISVKLNKVLNSFLLLNSFRYGESVLQVRVQYDH